MTQPARTHDFILSAQRAHEKFNLSFEENFDWLFTHGVVVKTPELFLLGYGDDRNDAWVVWWMEAYPARSPAKMLALAVRCMPYYRRSIGWARMLKNKPFKFYSTERIIQFSKAQ